MRAALRRVIQLVVVLLFVSFFSFGLLSLAPGDPVTAFGAIALPDFALALILSYWVGVKLHWLPSQGYVHPSDSLVNHFRSMALPAISLAVGQIAAYMRLLRSDMIATLQEDFILMAK